MTTLLTAQAYVFCQNPSKFCRSLHFKQRLPKYSPANTQYILGSSISSAAEKGNQEKNLLPNSESCRGRDRNTKGFAISCCTHMDDQTFFGVSLFNIHPRVVSSNHLVNVINFSHYYSCFHLYFFYSKLFPQAALIFVALIPHLQLCTNDFLIWFCLFLSNPQRKLRRPKYRKLLSTCTLTSVY